jgi:hypothetical protein
MTLGESKAELKYQVHRRVEGLVADCRTLLAVRTEQHQWFKKRQGEVGLGGGNFLIAIGLLALLNFLAKVHLWLVDSQSFATEANLEEVKAAKARVIEDIPDLRRVVKDRWMNPRPGDCNEQRAFIKLVEAMREEIDLGIADNKEAEEVWQKIRNKLTHMAMPDGGAGVYEGGHTLEEVETQIRNGPKAFMKAAEMKGADERWACISDRLNMDIPRIEVWLQRKIDACEDVGIIESALDWIRS